MLGSTSAGTLRLWKTAEGLRFAADAPLWAAGHIETIQRRDVRGCSFGFPCLADEWRMVDGAPLREIIDMEVAEITITPFPAYNTTHVSAEAAARSVEWWHKYHSTRLKLAR